MKATNRQPKCLVKNNIFLVGEIHQRDLIMDIPTHSSDFRAYIIKYNNYNKNLYVYIVISSILCTSQLLPISSTHIDPVGVIATTIGHPLTELM